MKFCYVDESKDGAGALVQTMVGGVVDAHRLNRSRLEFRDIFIAVEGIYPNALKELKGSWIFYGKKAWRDVDPELRKAIFHLFCKWLSVRKHRLALSAIDIENFSSSRPADFPVALKDIWVAGATHIALQLQKHHQSIKSNKGHTVLIFDENKVSADRLNEVLFEPPAWTDAYYRREKKQAALDQIIDSAFFTKSHHAGLAQVADLFAFVFRRHSELTDYGQTEEYSGEKADIEALWDLLVPQLIPKPHRWLASSKNLCGRAYMDLSPPSLLSV